MNKTFLLNPDAGSWHADPTLMLLAAAGARPGEGEEGGDGLTRRHPGPLGPLRLTDRVHSGRLGVKHKNLGGRNDSIYNLREVASIGHPDSSYVLLAIMILKQLSFWMFLWFYFKYYLSRMFGEINDINIVFCLFKEFSQRLSYWLKCDRWVHILQTKYYRSYFINFVKRTSK